MRKIELATRIAEETGLTRFKAEQVVEAILDAIKDALSREESVMLRRFGSFHMRAKRARVGRNPQTGEAAEIAARRVVRFTSGQDFNNAVNRPAEDRFPRIAW